MLVSDSDIRKSSQETIAVFPVGDSLYIISFKLYAYKAKHFLVNNLKSFINFLVLNFFRQY